MAINREKSLRCEWLKGNYTPGKAPLSCFWSLSKKSVPRAVDRNRLKRWGRENLRNERMTGHLTLLFLPAQGDFYKTLRKEDFDSVFYRLLGKIQKTHR